MEDYAPRTEKELDELFGSYTPPAPRLYVTPDRPEMPDAGAMAETQLQDAVHRIFEDSRHYPKFPWRELAALSGPMCPEDLIIIAARTGGGKSLFLQNLFDALIAEGRIGMFVGLEQKPNQLRIKWSCLRTDVAPKLMLAPGELFRTPTWQDASDKVQADMRDYQRSPEVLARAHFAEVRHINAAGLKQWTEWAVDHGCEFVMVDHIDRVNHGDGKNSFHEMSTTIRLAKELAAQHRLTMILASQLGRPADALSQFMPPNLHELRGGGTKEEEADTVLGIYRPLRPGVTDKELKAVRQGLKNRDDVIEPNTMGVMLLKHRLDGPVAGKMVKLGVRHQRVIELDERRAYS